MFSWWRDSGFACVGATSVRPSRTTRLGQVECEVRVTPICLRVVEAKAAANPARHASEPLEDVSEVNRVAVERNRPPLQVLCTHRLRGDVKCLGRAPRGEPQRHDMQPPAATEPRVLLVHPRSDAIPLFGPGRHHQPQVIFLSQRDVVEQPEQHGAPSDWHERRRQPERVARTRIRRLCRGRIARERAHRNDHIEGRRRGTRGWRGRGGRTAAANNHRHAAQTTTEPATRARSAAPTAPALLPRWWRCRRLACRPSCRGAIFDRVCARTRATPPSRQPPRDTPSTARAAPPPPPPRVLPRPPCPRRPASPARAVWRSRPPSPPPPPPHPDSDRSGARQQPAPTDW